MDATQTLAKSYDVIIVGGGAAGLSAAVMLGRARRSVLVVDAGRQRNRVAPHMHGLLSRDGMPPTELFARGRAEAQGYGVQIVDGEVRAVERRDDGFVARVRAAGTETEVAARQVVIATGLVDQLPPLPGIAELWGTGVVTCPYCDGWEVRDRALGVIATSPMSRNQAHLLRQWTSDLTVFGAAEAGIPDAELDLLRRRGIRLAPPARAVSGEMGDVRVATDAGDQRLTRVFIAGRPQPSDALLTALGCAVDDTPMGAFVRTDGSGRTSQPGVWAIGNVADPKALVPIAIGAGTAAATQINIALVEDELARLADA